MRQSISKVDLRYLSDNQESGQNPYVVSKNLGLLVEKLICIFSSTSFEFYNNITAYKGSDVCKTSNSAWAAIGVACVLHQTLEIRLM